MPTRIEFWELIEFIIEERFYNLVFLEAKPGNSQNWLIKVGHRDDSWTMWKIYLVDNHIHLARADNGNLPSLLQTKPIDIHHPNSMDHVMRMLRKMNLFRL